jgi:hypothetical protein
MSDAIQLFDSRGRFVCPTDEQVAAAGWDETKLQLFADLKAASTANSQVDEDLDAANKSVIVSARAATAARETLEALRPKLTHTQLAKDFIASQRAGG